MTVATQFDADQQLGRIILRPNQSWTWRANLWLLVSLATISLVAGITWTVLGYWPVLLFTSVELAIVGGCIYYCVRRTHSQEVLTFSPETLVVERGVLRATERHQYQRFWARIHIEAPRHAWYLPRIFVQARDGAGGAQEEIEIGSFLGREDKRQLETDLRRMVHKFT